MELQPKSKILDILYAKMINYTEMIKYDDESDKNTQIALQTEEEILEKIKSTPELSEMFKRYVSATEIKEISVTDLFFTEGFKMGLLIGIETGEWLNGKK